MITVSELLSSYAPPRKACLMGNEAVARGAIEAGVRGVFAYPGTPSTEISDIILHVSAFQNDPAYQRKHPELTAEPIYFEYSVNEKIALEKAIAYCLGNRRAMCCMKTAGINVAADPLMTIPYQTIGRALVIVVCDDPGCFSSTTEQDSRHFGKMASVPVFNPATPQDAYEMTTDAFALSEQLGLPVMVRMTTRVDHSRGIVHISKLSPVQQNPEFTKSQQHLNIPARTAIAHSKLIEKLEGDSINTFHRKNNVVFLADDIEATSHMAVIASGVAAVYALEIIHREQISDRVGLLKIGITHPFPSRDVIQFLQRGFSRVLVLEELDPIVENEIRILVQRNRLNVEIYGKNYAGLSAVGEYSLDIVAQAMAEFGGLQIERKADLRLEGSEIFLKDLPPRPPALCPGCPHRATFYVLKLLIHRGGIRPILCGDIGCFGLGALPPFQLMDTIHHMGMSISMAQGLSEAFHVTSTEKQKMVALVGDGTFYHSGVASLLNAVYTRANITVIIFDNRTIGMTGQQHHPGSITREENRQIGLPELLKGMGVEFIETIDPNDIAKCMKALDEAIAFEGVAVVIAKSPCVFLPEFAKAVQANVRIEVDHDLCNSCHNQEDAASFCSKSQSAESALSKARAKLLAEDHIPAVEQRCPANICNHGFLNAILTGDYQEAINIVRDKILFARACGEICPRPCEFLFKEDNRAVVPIRKLKEFVAKMDQNFNDMSVPKARRASSVKRDKKVAVVGAGPSGLSAAYDLTLVGYDVTVFEKEKEAGGLLKFAIPGFRIDKIGYDTEIALLGELGVEFKFNNSLGSDFGLEKLAAHFDAVIVSIGMGKSLTLATIEERVPPENRYDAISFLRQYNQGMLKLKPGGTVLVIGGGNSAFDAARAAKRSGAKYVNIIYRRSRSEMPAFNEEIESAISEGIHITYDSVVDSCEKASSGRIKVFLKSFKERHILGEMFCDYIIAAIGQRGEKEAIESRLLQSDDENRILADMETGHTGYKNVFVAGDVCAGNHVSLIGAISGGKKAAVGVRKLLEGYPFAYEGQKALSIMNSQPRAGIKSTPTEERKVDKMFIETEMRKYYLFQPCGKCDHCIENFGCPALIKAGGKVVVDDNQCNRCGLCIDVCINNAIRWVKPLATLELTESILMTDD